MSFLVNFPSIFAYDDTSKLTILLVNHPSSLAFWMDCSHTLCGFLAFLAFDGARIYDIYIYKWKKHIEWRLKTACTLIYIYIYITYIMHIFANMYTFQYRSIDLSIHLSIYRSIDLSIYLSIPIYLFLSISIYSYLFLSIPIYLFLSIYSYLSNRIYLYNPIYLILSI